ncbi:MAG: hypothetical protein H0V17_13575 [Deltaproteobacteria bacterium]|nr:hypothetical protein [Deltaproteobacteria bacterium]
MVDADDDDKPSPERTQTDASLRVERDNADAAMRAKQADARADADQVIKLARDTADAVLDAAREKADIRLGETAKHAVIAERVIEDAVLHDERASADAELQRERAESIDTLARLLPMEREKTDRYLLTERIRSDKDVSHRDDFLGIVSHDLRNLLSGIVLTAYMIEPVEPQAAAKIHRYAARMNRLIGDLVDVASIDSGKLSITRAEIDMAAVIDEAIDMFQGLANTKTITIETRIPERPLPANLDHDRMIQVLANLITNAVKFTPDGGAIVLQADRVAGGIQVSVQDTGMGIAGDKLETVFERFWQVGKNDRRGVGLGLYISRCIVEAHGGKIWAESTPGAGSTFSFTLG